MPTPLDYAQLSDFVYANVRSDVNAPLRPTSWADISGEFGINPAVQSGSGFSAGVFKNGNAIVISYEGTNPSPLSADGLADWLGMSLGSGSQCFPQGACCDAVPASRMTR